MKKSILAGLVILVILAVAGCRSIAIGTASPAVTSASSPVDAPASNPADAPASTPADAPADAPASGTADTPAVPAATHAAGLATTYNTTYDNLTYGISSVGTLTQVTENAAGDITGQLTVDPPLYGSGPFTGTVNGNAINFTVESVTPNPAGGTSGTFTGTIGLQGSLSGTYADDTSNGPQNGNWTATPLTMATPTSSACSTATATYEADQKALKALQSASEDDAALVKQDIAALTGAVDDIPSNVAELYVGDIRKIILNSMDPETTDLFSDLADTFFQRAAALESAEAAQAGAIIDIINSKLIPVLGLPALAVTSKNLGKLFTAEVALKVALVQGEAAQAAADAAQATMEKACQAGSAD
jgi:hypothetical protein